MSAKLERRNIMESSIDISKYKEIFENINESIQQILNSFVGKTLQKPPMYLQLK